MPQSESNTAMVFELVSISESSYLCVCVGGGVDRWKKCGRIFDWVGRILYCNFYLDTLVICAICSVVCDVQINGEKSGPDADFADGI